MLHRAAKITRYLNIFMPIQNLLVDFSIFLKILLISSKISKKGFVNLRILFVVRIKCLPSLGRYKIACDNKRLLPIHWTWVISLNPAFYCTHLLAFMLHKYLQHSRKKGAAIPPVHSLATKPSIFFEWLRKRE